LAAARRDLAQSEEWAEPASERTQLGSAAAAASSPAAHSASTDPTQISALERLVLEAPGLGRLENWRNAAAAVAAVAVSQCSELLARADCEIRHRHPCVSSSVTVSQSSPY